MFQAFFCKRRWKTRQSDGKTEVSSSATSAGVSWSLRKSRPLLAPHRCSSQCAFGMLSKHLRARNQEKSIWRSLGIKQKHSKTTSYTNRICFPMLLSLWFLFNMLKSKSKWETEWKRTLSELGIREVYGLGAGERLESYPGPHVGQCARSTAERFRDELRRAVLDAPLRRFKASEAF